MVQMHGGGVRHCRDCSAEVKGKRRSCAECAYRRKREAEQRAKNKKALRPVPAQNIYPPLLNGYPPMSRGWFRVNIVAGHTALSLSDLTGLNIEYIRRELSFMPGVRTALLRGKPTTRFTKGYIPWNKGRRGIHLSRETEFKKGCRPAGWKPVGTITVRLDKKTKTPRQFIKTGEPHTWIRYAHYVWRKNGGKKIPRGFVLHHRNLDTMNADFPNLEVISRGTSINAHRPLFEARRRRAATAAQTLRWNKYRMAAGA